MSGILLASTTGEFWYITGIPQAYMEMYGFLAKISGLYIKKAGEKAAEYLGQTVNPVHSFTKNKRYK